MIKRVLQIITIAISIVINRFRAFKLSLVLKKCGNNLSVFGYINVINPKRLSIGNDCCINHFCYINALNPITIGDDVTMSANVSIISTGIDVRQWIKGSRNHTSSKGINIGSHVWIGAGATILEGVNIPGPYVVVAAGAVVTHDVLEPFCVVAGIPAVIVKKYDVLQT